MGDQEGAVWRETFLDRIASTHHAKALRQIGELLAEALNEGGEFGPPEREESLTRAELAAVARDLDLSAEFMAYVHSAVSESALPKEDLKLALKAEQWSAEAGRLASEIREALGVVG